MLTGLQVKPVQLFLKDLPNNILLNAVAAVDVLLAVQINGSAAGSNFYN
jgi:hypothetical protein